MIEECNSKDPRAFWNYIKKLGPNKKGHIPWEVEEDGKLITNKVDVLNRWKDDFSKVYKNNKNIEFDENFKTESYQKLYDLQANCDITLKLNKPINYAEVQQAVKEQKTGKAPGADNITNELLKSDEVIELLHGLFTMCFNNSLIPEVWRTSIINPIPKTSGFVNDLLKYRGLALQSCIYKTFSSILNKRITDHLESHIVDEQNGFRGGCSCQHQVFALQTLIRNECQIKRKSLYAIFVDFQKAFDYVDRDLLLYTLAEYGVNGKIWSILQQMYLRTTNRIRVNGELSDYFESKLGVRQGDPSSPGHFNAFINGLLKELKTAKCRDKYRWHESIVCSCLCR